MRDLDKKRAADKAYRERKKAEKAQVVDATASFAAATGFEQKDEEPPPYQPEFDDGRPEMCHKCEEDIKDGESTKVVTVDLDPGDCEVGPDPDIQDIIIHENCFKQIVPTLSFDEVIRNDGCWWVLPVGKLVLSLVND